MTRKTLLRFWLAALVLWAGCADQNAPADNSRPASQTLRIGLGVAASSGGGEQAGIRQVVQNISSEPLLNYGKDGRPVPILAESWETAGDGLSLRLKLRDAHFHDGSAVSSTDVLAALERGMPRLMGPAYSDVREIQAPSAREIEISLTRPSPFPLEALDLNITKPGAPPISAGPYRQVDSQSADGSVEMVASDNYHLGTPALRRIVLKPYQSVRSAWADLLRGNVDMLYEVGSDALDSLEPSSRVETFFYRRHYAYVVLFNLRNPALQNPAMRRRLNAAINREELIARGLGGRGAPSVGPVWPEHWANAPDAPRFVYSPERIASGTPRLRLRCIIGDPTHERLAIVLQRQLQSVGVDLDLQLVGVQDALKRLDDHDFDLLLAEVISGPSLFRPYLFWHSKGPYNYGGFSSPAVDTALDSIRHSTGDDSYRAGVAAFQQAIVNDPPAIFLAWSERARAVSTAFDVQAEPGRDPLSTLRLWRPTGPGPVAHTN